MSRIVVVGVGPGDPDLLTIKARDILQARELPGSLVHSVGGLAVLLVITVLNVHKPRGLTPYGWRKQQEERRKRREQSTVSQS